MATSQLPDCKLCQNVRHVRILDGEYRGQYRRCDCLIPLINIKPIVRGSDHRYPAKYDNYPPYPLQDLVLGGVCLRPAEQFKDFRYMVWRSLLTHSETLSYEYLNGYRIVDMQFHKDPVFDTPQELGEPDLVILMLAMADTPNKMMGPLIIQVVSNRQFHGKPTWIYTPLSRVNMRDEYGSSTATLLGDPVKPLEVKL